jgi:hypothetical protein
MTEAQEETEERKREERECKTLEQRREEMMSRVAAENERIRESQTVAAGLAQALSEIEELDAAHPRFARVFTPEPVDCHQSLTTLGPVGDEDDPVSEDPSEKDPKAVYLEDEERKGASQ